MNKYEMKKNILPSTIYFFKVQVKLHGLLKKYLQNLLGIIFGQIDRNIRPDTGSCLLSG
jgi:hypothetical protein